MNYILGKYKYFDTFVLINHHYFNTLSIGNNIRNLSEDNFYFYDNLIKNFFEETKLKTNLEDIIEKILNLLGTIWCCQPFKDGNTRTMKCFLKLYFNNLNYEIDLTNKETIVIPIFYYPTDKCTKSDIENFKKRLKKKD